MRKLACVSNLNGIGVADLLCLNITVLLQLILRVADFSHSDIIKKVPFFIK